MLRVTKLTKDCEYVFRIKAENKCGTSDAISSELVKASYPFGRLNYLTFDLNQYFKVYYHFIVM